MKALVTIWVAVVAVALGTGAYVNAAINERVAEFHIERVSKPVNPQQTISGELLQPAGKVKPNFTDTYNPQQTVNANQLQGN